jgi:hypothetical protein
MKLGHFVLVLIAGACSPGRIDDPQECYALEANGDWPLEPEALVENFCGRGPTPSEGPNDGRGVTAVCLPAPAGGCDPCILSNEAADARLREQITTTFEDAGCPADYEPERFVRGCFAAWPEQDQCCYTAEYFTNKLVCDPVPDEVP